MSKAKRNGFTILLAAALSFIFAAFLCLGFPMAEVRAAETTVVTDEDLLQTIENAEEGTTIRLGGGITQSIIIPKEKNITLDLAGNTVTNTKDEHTIVNYGTLTVIDTVGGGTVDNVSNGCAALKNYGTAYIGTEQYGGGTFTRSADQGVYLGGESDTGGNSYYTVKNLGYLEVSGNDTVITVNTEVRTLASGKTGLTGSAASLVANGYYSADEYGKEQDNVTYSNNPTLVVNGGKFEGGMNTVKNDGYGNLTLRGGKFINYTQTVIMNSGSVKIENGSFDLIEKIEGSFSVEGADGFNPSEAVIYATKDSVANKASDTAVTGGTFTATASEGTPTIGVAAVGEASVALEGEDISVQAHDGLIANSAGSQISVSGATVTADGYAAYLSGGDSISLNGGSYTGKVYATKAADGSYDLIIAEGTFSVRPDNKYFAEDVVVIAAEDGSFGIGDKVDFAEEIDAAAVQVGGNVFCNTVQEAFDVANNNENIYLRKNVTEDVTFTNERTVNLYLNGYTVDGDIENKAPGSNNRGKLNIYDKFAEDSAQAAEFIGTVGAGVGTVTGKLEAKGTGSKASITVYGGLYEGAVYARETGSVSIHDGTFNGTVWGYNNLYIYGGTFAKAVYAYGGSMTVTDGVFNNRITVRSTKATLEGGTFNKTITVTSGSLLVTGGTFEAEDAFGGTVTPVISFGDESPKFKDVSARECEVDAAYEFSAEPQSGYYVLVDAEIFEANGTKFNNLEEASAAAGNGGTVTLLRNFAALDTQKTVASITLDLGGLHAVGRR